MNKEEKQFADIVEKALELQKNGIALEEILAMAGERKDELAEILAAASDFKNVKNKIVPPRALLEKIVAVTGGADFRYNKQGVGRLPLINILINKNFNFMNWRIMVPAGVAAIALTVFVSWQMMPGAVKPIPEIAKQAPEIFQNEPASVAENAADSAKAGEIALAPEVSAAEDDETESIESIIDSLSADDYSYEEAAAFDEDADAFLLAADSREIDNFNQIYDEKEF